MGRAGVALALMILAVIVCVIVLQVTGMVDFVDMAIQHSKGIPALAPYVEVYRLGVANSRDLAARAQELDLRAAELDKAWAEVAQARREIEQLRAELERQERDQRAEAERLKNLGDQLREKEASLVSIEGLRKIYSEMKPEEAAQILSELDEESLVRILGGMKANVAADLLSALDPKIAARISLRMMENKQ